MPKFPVVDECKARVMDLSKVPGEGSSSPYFMNKEGFYFANETWDTLYGPYDSLEEAKEACKVYAQSL